MRNVLILMLLLFPLGAYAQNDLAAVMVVDAETVEMQRVNTEQWIPIRVEAIVGVGDMIRTSDNGRATITFFADGVETTLEPNTTYRIDEFNGNNAQFNLSVSVLVGQTQQRIERALDAGSNYDVNTPGAELVARGTEFRVRVEDSGRSAMLVSEGNVEANAVGETEQVPPQFGIRSEEGGRLSDVVRASSFAELDAAIDGCDVTVTAPGDVRLNVRLGPGTNFQRVGTVAPEDITNVKGETPGADWYRIDFRGGFGWILSSEATIVGDCAGLREFTPDFGPEDASQYEFIGDPIELDGAAESEPGEGEESSTP